MRGVTFDVELGEIFGLIGPDGAGKTSTFQILAGVMEATSGVADIFGQPARETRSHTGYLTQTFSLYPDLTVAENIRYIGDLRRVPRNEIERRGLHYLRMFDMDRFTDRLAGRLSGGMKQKLALACALVPEPRVLLLDEPTTGVDPVSRREFWDALAHLAADGLTILVATPYLDEAERCHRVALMHDGEIQQIGTPAEIRAQPRRHAARGAHRPVGRGRTGAVGDARSRTSTSSTCSDSATGSTCWSGSQNWRSRRFASASERPAWRSTRFGGTSRFSKTCSSLDCTRSASRCGTRRFRSATIIRTFAGGVAIGAANLTKTFGAFRAVNDVTLQVRYGEVYGLLGANGAGKTTTIKMLCGLLDPTQRRGAAGGRTRRLRSSEVRQRIGYMSQKFSLYDDLPIDENLGFFAGVYGVPASERDEKIRWVLAFAGLEGRAHQLVGSLPGGWKQRVAFGAAIMHEPSVLFLDEPTSGVDPVARRAFWQLINRLADAGTAILVTTHYLEEAEQCNRLGLMVAGELVAEGAPTAIKSGQRGHLLELHVDRSAARRRSAEAGDGPLARVAVRRPPARHHRRRGGAGAPLD